MNPWDRALRPKLTRYYILDCKNEVLEPGVNYFILALEKLGAKTIFSCEGHPDGFYIVFKSSCTLARRISSCGYISVEVCGRDGYYRLSLYNDTPSERKKRHILRQAALAWERLLFSGIKRPKKMSRQMQTGVTIIPFHDERYAYERS